ncbi:MAG TPA: septal ring lytic transglycosylase RlpA family protein [Candidatus Angelobacter sp.]|nr:septal ring lytic transglycosylase RlpA family protein [Candidatus Angelobacter sp.]
MLAGCGSHRQAAKTNLPPPPSAPSSADRQPGTATAPAETTDKPSPAVHPGAPASGKEIVVPADAKSLFTETGLASWYGPHYNKRPGANGEVYDMDAMTAAHRTIPLNSTVRVTNIKTSQSVLLRITDRGPFVSDRIIDLSKAAAQKLDVYRAGTAMVKVEVLESPVPLLQGGRWCVQIGGFRDTQDAAKLKNNLMRRYHTAQVLQFRSPVGEDWLRIRVADDDKQRAESLMKETHTDAGMYLVRLD